MSDFEVKFSNLTIPDGRDLVRGRRVVGAIDPSWIRIRLNRDDPFTVDRWIEQNTSGRWSRYVLSLPRQDDVLVVAFEDEIDAVLFKLSDAENKA